MQSVFFALGLFFYGLGVVFLISWGTGVAVGNPWLQVNDK